MVFVGPYEHHSNELPWRESIADVVVIGEDADGHVDLADLESQLVRYAQRPLLIGSFSAASNVTGILTDTSAVAALLHTHGALSFWDYAAAGPYVPIRVSASRPDQDDHKDAIFLSPQQPPGRAADSRRSGRTPRSSVRNEVPTVPGGGTVAFVDPVGHRYLDDPVAREEGGTPAIIESIRAGLVVGLKQAVGTDLIAAREERLWRHVLRRWADSPGIEILGSRQAARLSIVSFRIRHGVDFLHHNFVVAVLNDLFGIQARGGCSFAGPYGHRLLAIGAALSARFARRNRSRLRGCETRLEPGQPQLLHLRRPGRLHRRGRRAHRRRRLSPAPPVRFDPHTGLWRHASGPPRPQISLADVTYGPDGTMNYPRGRGRAGEDAFPGYLRQARALLAALSSQLDDGNTGLSPEFEALRWSRSRQDASARSPLRRARCRPASARAAACPARAQPDGRVFGDVLQQRLAGDISDSPRVERLDDGAVTGFADNHIARQQQAGSPVRRQGPVRERRVTCPEDDVLLHLLAELLPQRRLHVDLGQHAEANCLQRLADLGVCLGERGRRPHGNRIIHGHAFLSIRRGRSARLTRCRATPRSGTASPSAPASSRHLRRRSGTAACRRHDLETCPVQRPGHRSELHQHVLAVTARLDHRDNSGQLALGTAKPVQHRAGHFLINPHGLAPLVLSTIPMGVLISQLCGLPGPAVTCRDRAPRLPAALASFIYPPGYSGEGNVNRGGNHMCHRVTCRTCKKPTYRGCGMHVEEVLAGVPKSQRCSCDHPENLGRGPAREAAAPLDSAVLRRHTPAEVEAASATTTGNQLSVVTR